MNLMTNKPVACFAAEDVIKRSGFGVNPWVDKAGVLGDDVNMSLLLEAGTAGD